MSRPPHTHIALLRAVNVGGNTKVAMAELRRLIADLGFFDVTTLLQSGNAVFRGGRRTGATLERHLEAEVRTRLGIETDFLVRSAAEWGTIVEGNPFPAEARKDPGHLLVLVLKEGVEPKAVKALQAAIKGPELVRGSGSHIYMVYPAGVGTSKVTNALIERHLGTRATGRNWNTVVKIGAAAGIGPGSP